LVSRSGFRGARGWALGWAGRAVGEAWVGFPDTAGALEPDPKVRRLRDSRLWDSP
jgi:hypothetical protein